jgi:hypothetical protein
LNARLAKGNAMKVKKRLSAWILLAPLAVLLMASAVAVLLLSGGSAAGTLPSGRTVTTSSDSIWLESRLTSDSAYITTAGRAIVVRPKVVTVDGKPLAEIDASAKDVRITVANGSVGVSVDGVAIK